MSISDADYLAWLAKDGQTRVLLVEVGYHDGSTAGTQYLANRPYTSTGSDTPAHTYYDDRIREGIKFTRRMSEQLAGQTTQSWGDIVLDNLDGTLDTWLTYGFDGRALKIYFGDPSWPKADFRLILDGICADIIARDQETVSLKARDKQHLLTKQISTSTFSSGDASGKVKPLAFGACTNISPVLEDAATHKYKVHDGAVNSIAAVRDNGVAVAHTDTVASGYFVLTASPAGQITCDVQGAKPSSYLTKVGDIASHIVQTYAGLSAGEVDSTAISTLNTDCPQTVGLYVREGGTIMQALDELLLSVGGFYGFTRDGKFSVGRLVDPASGTSTLTLYADDIEERGVSIKSRTLPTAQVILGYDRRWTRQEQGLAGAVTEANRAYYSTEYSAATATNGTVGTKHQMATKPALVGTLLSSSSDASTEATRRKDLYNAVRTVYTVRCSAAPFRVDVGQIVTVDYPRFGFAGGVKCVVVGFEESPIDGRLVLEVWR